MIDVIITSWQRHDLLNNTLESLYGKNRDLIRKCYIREDGNLVFVKTKFPIFIFGGNHIGQVESIDKLMKGVETHYYLHLEDDWECLESGGIEEAISILENNPDCCSVSLRGNSTRAHNGQPSELIDGVWRMQPWSGWSGFSFAPSVRRLSDYTPYQEITEFDPKKPWEAEREIGNKMSKGKWCATTEKQYFKHIGSHNSTLNFK